jgi:hypothetical protein
MKENENPFIVLIGEQLSSVTFVQDYLQLDFDGKKLTCYEWPIVVLSGQRFDINVMQYRNALCSLIAKEIKDTIFIDAKMLELNFETEEQIVFDFEQAKGEVIYFVTPEGEWSSIAI